MPSLLRRALLLLFLLAPRSPAAAGTSGLEEALESVQARHISADVFFFASDAMRGRDTPSLELKVAARFLRARLERLGLEPGAGTSFFHEYPLHARRIDPERAFLSLRGPAGERRFRFGQEYFLPSSSDLVEFVREGELVFCGRGERDDFKAAPAVRGRWAVCLTSDLSARRRARYAEGAGALGLIVLPDPAGQEDPLPEECARATEFALEGLVSATGTSAAERAEKVFPQVFLALSAARELLRLAGRADLPATGQELGLFAREERTGSGAIPVENVCALWPGSDPLLAQELIIVSAHYDHVGVDQAGRIHPGADDNGSGSMGLLALAEALKDYGPLRRSVLLMWVSGEEKGLWGSAAWTRAPLLRPGMRPVCNINIDMIGRNAPDYLLVTPTSALEEYNGLTRLAERLAPLEGFPKLGSADDYWMRSDHMNFAVHLKVPVCFLFSDVHEDYHQPGDRPEKIDCDKVRRVTRLVLRMLDALQTDEISF
jgi:hypothetical protein